MPDTLVDATHLGRLLRSARIAAGAATVSDAVEMFQKVGYDLSARALGSLERGETRATMDFILAALLAYNPQGGLRFFSPCVREDAQRAVCRP